MVVAGHPWEATQRVLRSVAQRARIVEDLKRSLASHRPLLWLRSSRSYAMHRTSPSPPAGEGRGEGPVLAEASRRRAFALGSSGSPYDSGGLVEESPQGGRMDAGQFFDRTRTSCRKTPQPARVPSVHRTEGASSGVPFSLALPPSRWLLSLGQARESNPAFGKRTEARRRRARSRYRNNQRPTKLDDQLRC